MISVVVCTYNRRNYLLKCLDCLSKQTANSDFFEVIVVNNNSPDDTEEEALELFSEKRFSNFKYFKETNQGHSFSRNRGIKESLGDIISFLDDDSFAKPTYIEELSKLFSIHTDMDILGGKIVPLYEKEEPKWMTKYLLPLVAAIDLGEGTKRFPKNKFPIGANMAFRKRVFDENGVFNVNLGRVASGLEGGDEKDMINRARKKGAVVYYSSLIEVGHIIPEKRLSKNYIKGLAEGVGKSEKKRIAPKSFTEKLKRTMEEFIKIIGSLVLAMLYLIKLQPHKSKRLIEFRYWVILGFAS